MKRKMKGNGLMNYSDEEFTAIMDEYGDTVLRICYVRLKNMFDAQDAFQEVFISLYNAKNKPEPDALKPWLIKAACNRCISVLRLKKPVSALDESLSAGEAPHDTTVREALIKLPKPQRMAIYMFYFENMSAREIADAMSIEANNVRVILHRGREKLKELLKEDYYEFEQHQG